MKITVGGHEIILEPKAQKNSSTYKRYDRTEQLKVMLPYVDCLDIGSVIVQLMDDDDPVCFYKDNIQNFLDHNPEKMQWYAFLPDACVNKVKHPF